MTNLRRGNSNGNRNDNDNGNGNSNGNSNGNGDYAVRECANSFAQHDMVSKTAKYLWAVLGQLRG
jgi:hypothetical protein